MNDSTKHGSGSGATMRAVGMLAAVVGSAGALLGGLAAAGYIGGGDGPETPPSTAPSTVPSTTPSTAPSTTPPVDPEPISDPPATPATVAPAPTRGDIDILYRADSAPGCVVAPTITIGDQVGAPSDLAPTIFDVALGLQSYSVSGLIECFDSFGASTWCTIAGSGQIDVVDGRSYFVIWNVSPAQFGVCDVWLSDV